MCLLLNVQRKGVLPSKRAWAECSSIGHTQDVFWAIKIEPAMRIPFHLLVIVVACIYATCELHAQTMDTISSDRSGMTLTANTVGARGLQFQLGSFLRQTATLRGFGEGFIGGQYEGVIRVGIIERMEVGFSVAYTKMHNERIVPYAGTETLEDFGFGISVRGNMLQSNGKTPNIGLLAEVNFPDKDTYRYTDNISSRFMLLLAQPLTKYLQLSSNIGMTYANKPILLYTLNLSARVSKRVNIFVEHFGVYSGEYDSPYTYYPIESDKVHRWFANVTGGVTALATRDLLIDLQGGYGGLEVAPETWSEWRIELGLSWRIRIPKRLKEPKQQG